MHALWLVTMVFGSVASLIAHGKGRNAMGWFLAGTFIGPFALVVAFLPPVTREGMYVQCPACKEVIRADAATCRYCRGIVQHA
jgi:hypothetical protein